MADVEIEVLQKSIDATKISEKMIKERTFPKAIDQEEWESKVQDFFENEEDEKHGYITVETSPEDMKKIEELLNAKKGFFSTPYVVKTKQEFCPYCNRRNNFLDVVATGLKVHSAEFLVAVFTGKYGHIINTAPHQRCFCYQCNNELPNEATKFSAPKIPTEEERNHSQYSYPVYTYKF